MMCIVHHERSKAAALRKTTLATVVQEVGTLEFWNSEQSGAEHALPKKVTDLWGMCTPRLKLGGRGITNASAPRSSQKRLPNKFTILSGAIPTCTNKVTASPRF